MSAGTAGWSGRGSAGTAGSWGGRGRWSAGTAGWRGSGGCSVDETDAGTAFVVDDRAADEAANEFPADTASKTVVVGGRLLMIFQLMRLVWLGTKLLCLCLAVFA